jgi:putative ABC transport system permease protein
VTSSVAPCASVAADGRPRHVPSERSGLPTIAIIGAINSRNVAIMTGNSAAPVLAKDSPSGGVFVVSFGGSSTVARLIRETLATLEPATVIEPRTVASTFRDRGAKFGVLVKFVSLLGLVAIFLAVIGLYGVVAFAVASRTKEVGVRLALGATKSSVIRALLASGIAPVVVGLACGLLLAAAIAFAMTRVRAATPVPIAAKDPATFARVTGLLVVTVMLAMLVPAWRATAGNPIDALRQEKA